MLACGDTGLQLRVSRVRVLDKVRVSIRDSVGIRVAKHSAANDTLTVPRLKSQRP